MRVELTLGVITPSPCSRAGGSDGKASACNAGDLGSIPGSGRSPGKGNGYTLYYSCLENPTGQRGLADTVHGGH